MITNNINNYLKCYQGVISLNLMTQTISRLNIASETTRESVNYNTYRPNSSHLTKLV